MEISVIKEICNACWLNQIDLADFTGIKLQRIKDISSGRVDGFKGDDIAVLVQKLHLNIDWLTTGSGEVFREGYSRSYPSKGEFVAEVLNRLVKLVSPIEYQPVIDDVLDLKKGSAVEWIKKGYIPYWFLKGFAVRHGLEIDNLIYGFKPIESDKYKTLNKVEPPVSGSGINKALKTNEKSSLTMHMSTSVSDGSDSTGKEVDEFILSSCLDACIKVYGNEFDTSPAAVQMGYAVDLYNLLVRMSDAMGDSLDKMCRLESDGFAQQLQLFIKLHKVRRFPPNKNEAYMF